MGLQGTSLSIPFYEKGDCMGRLIDLTGKKFNHLTVIERAKNIGKETAWLCECDCENKTRIVVMGNHLKDGHTKSCGCWLRECVSKRMKKYNTFDIKDDYVIGYDYNGNEFYVDLIDFDKIKNICWHKNPDGYFVSGNECLHRVIMNNPINKRVDHIGGDTTRWDNRRYNLRISTPSQNNQNKKKQSNNKSGVTGVFWDKSKNKWIPRIRLSGKDIYLGVYDNFDDAVKVRKAAEEKYFGEWSYDNSQKTYLESIN